MDWKFWIGDIAIPVLTLIVGFFTGKTIEKRKNNKTKVKGNGNTIIQGNDFSTKGD